MPVCVSLIMLAAYFCQSPLIKGQLQFNKDECTVKLLAAGALLVQSGALLVSNNCFIKLFLELSSVKPIQLCSAQAGRQVISTALAAPKRNCEPLFCL